MKILCVEITMYLQPKSTRLLLYHCGLFCVVFADDTDDENYNDHADDRGCDDSGDGQIY